MYRRTKSHHKHIKPVRLYLDDVEEICKILHEVTESVQLITEDYLFEEPEQLAELRKDYITDLEIRSSNPFISVDLKPGKGWLYIAKDEPASRGVFEKVMQFLEERRYPLWRFTTFPSILLFSSCLGLSLAFLLVLATGILELGLPVIVVSAVGVLVFVLLILHGVEISSKKYSVVFLTHRANAQPFLKRNRDQIILALISAILGGLVTLFVSRFTGAE